MVDRRTVRTSKSQSRPAWGGTQRNLPGADRMEINTVYYETDKISVEAMEAALKAAGTYKGIIEE